MACYRDIFILTLPQWGTHIPGGTRTHVTGYAKRLKGVCKIEKKYIVS
jgi:hypothetical protein